METGAKGRINRSSKYFDTLNHAILLNILRRTIKDERVIQIIKRYLKSDVMENGGLPHTKSEPTVSENLVAGV